jgi:hypothetical protein
MVGKMVRKISAYYETLMFNWRVSTYVTIYGETGCLEVIIAPPPPPPPGT